MRLTQVIYNWFDCPPRLIAVRQALGQVRHPEHGRGGVIEQAAKAVEAIETQVGKQQRADCNCNEQQAQPETGFVDE